MSSAYEPTQKRESAITIIGRVLLNVLLAYGIAAVVTFCMILAKEVMSPSEFNPYFGQAAGGTAWTIGWFSFGSPAVLLVLACLDWALRHTRRQRLVGSAVSLLPAAFWIVVVLVKADGELLGFTYASWLLIVGLIFGRLMLLPPRPS